jgi:uncharacterized caspase-like protein
VDGRRGFLKALAAVPLVRAIPPAFAEDGSRVVLAIGNNAYEASPLLNPVNDARAVGELFRTAGFRVDLQTNANLQTMAAAVERFGAAVRRSETRMAVFYYAGHGAQVDWKNYLLPVDAVVRNSGELKSRCLDLGTVLQHFAKAGDKTFIVILDACRDNPFGQGYRTEAKGLSQFDAPVGSLLAYATAPGNVALDGDGNNGLYTSNLVRELSVRGVRIEDCLKRVRLNVRLASQGAQIPWESTSLEGDVFIFPDPAKKLDEQEIERQFGEELANWNRIKGSQKIDDWVAYLKNFPDGRFSEVAQARLARLLATVERRTPDPGADKAKAVEIRPDRPVPSLFQPSANPYSAGTYPLGRDYSVGDMAVYRKSDQLTGLEEGVVTTTVTRVDRDNDWVDLNEGRYACDLLGNPIKSPQRVFDGPMQFYPVELQLGKRWRAHMAQTNQQGKRADVEFEVRIAAFEKISVPAGEFHAFRIEASGWNLTFGKRLERRFWVVPGLNFAVKIERNTYNRRGKPVETEREELLSLHQAGR